MGRSNIQHPITKQWRCYSTVVDAWITDWMDEEAYKEWLIQDAANVVREELAEYGIRSSVVRDYNDAVFSAASMKWRNEHCKDCSTKDCDKCKVWQYPDWFSYMIADCEDFLGCRHELVVMQKPE